MPKPPTRPYVTINMAMSADGKISTRRREPFSLGSKEDRYLMDKLRARADAVVIGARTLKLDGWAIRVRDAGLRAKRRRRTGTPHPLNVVLSTQLAFPATAQFLTHGKTDKLIITSSAASTAKVRRLEKIVEVVVLPQKRIDPRRVLEILSKRGMKKVLVEGGGELNFSFFSADLVDEIYITVAAKIIGGRAAPTVVDGDGFLAVSHVALELVSSRRRGDEVFLRYRVVR